MAISVFDMFTIGIGPSSSHTVGPMRAARRFVCGLQRDELLTRAAAIKCELFGSLGQTGRGHGSGPAVLLGLEGAEPETVEPDRVPTRAAEILERGRINLLGVHEVRWSTQVWGGGGGAVAAAVNCAAAAVHSGQAECVAVYRGLSEGTDGRGAYNKGHMGHLYAAHGMLAPAQVCALRTQRMLEVDHVPESALEAVALAGYHHAQNNPRAVACGRPLDHDRYRGSRPISDPLRLYTPRPRLQSAPMTTVSLSMNSTVKRVGSSGAISDSSLLWKTSHCQTVPNRDRCSTSTPAPSPASEAGVSTRLPLSSVVTEAAASALIRNAFECDSSPQYIRVVGPGRIVIASPSCV